MQPSGATWWALIGALLAAALLVLVPLILSRLPRPARQSLLRLLAGLGLDAPGTVRALTPRVEFVAEQPAPSLAASSTFATLVAEWLRGAALAEATAWLDTSAGHLTRPRDLVGTAPDPVRGALRRLLLRPDRLLVHAHVHPVSVRGGGVSLRLTELDGRTICAGTIWNDEPAPDDAVAAQWLAPRAAAWLADALHRQAPSALLRSPLVDSTGQGPRYAAFLAGVEATLDGRFDSAAATFHRASMAGPGPEEPPGQLARDAARVNESFARLCTGSDRNRQHAIVTLLTLAEAEELRRPAGGTPALRARLTLVTALLDSCAAGSGDPGTVHDALQRARALAVEVLEPTADPAVAGLHDLLRGSVLLLLARAAALRDALKDDEPERSCLRGTAATDLVGSIAPDALERLRGLVELIDPERPDAGPAPDPRDDEAADPLPDRLVRAVVALLPLRPDARYVLACYLAQTHATATLAEHLDEIRAGRLLGTRAANDPVLGPHLALTHASADPAQLSAALRSLRGGTGHQDADDTDDPLVADLLALLRQPGVQAGQIRELRARLDSLSAGLARLQEAQARQAGQVEGAAGRGRDREARLEQRLTAVEQGQQRTATHLSGLAGRLEATAQRQDRLDIAASRATAAGAEVKVLAQRVEVLARKAFGTRPAPREIDLRDSTDSQALFPQGWFRPGGKTPTGRSRPRNDTNGPSPEPLVSPESPEG